jgi:hypothetical protein
MDTSMIVVVSSLLVVVAALGVVFIVMKKHRSGELTEEPNDLQFPNRNHFPGETRRDLNVVKQGKTKTLRSFTAQGSMNWDDFFDSKNQDQAEEKLTATYMIIGFYVVAGVVTAAMALMNFTLGYYFGLLCIGYATIIIAWNYIKAKRKKDS